MDRLNHLENNSDSAEQELKPALHIDDNFIQQFQDVLTSDQCETLSQYYGLTVDTALCSADTPLSFTQSLRRRLHRNPRTANIANSSDAQTKIMDDDGEGISLIDFGVRLIIEDLEETVATIKNHAPIERNLPKESIMHRALRYLRPDLWEEAQARHAQAGVNHEVEQNQRKVIRDRNFNKVCSMLSGLSDNPGAAIAESLPMASLIELAQTAARDQHPLTDGGLDVKTSTPSRMERLSRYHYQKPIRHNDRPLTHGRELMHDEEARPFNIIRESDVLVENRGTQDFEFPWLSTLPVQRDVARYSLEIHIDRVHALSSSLQKIAVSLDRNPINSQGHDKYEAIVDHLARRIARGVMPWESANSIKREKSKIRNADKCYPEAIWFSFDRSPNAPRVYFTLSQEQSVEDDSRPCRQLIILAETDKAHELEVLSELTGLGVKRLRSQGAGAQ